MACLRNQSGQGAYRNGRKPNKHNGVPGVEHFTKKKRYHSPSLAARRTALLELTKDVIDLTAEEVELFLEQEWHEYDEIQQDSLPETLEGGRNG